MRTFFLSNQADMRGFFQMIPWIFLFLIPAVSMRMWAEERKLGTVELLLSWPIKDWQVVLGKFLAALIFIAIAVAGTFVIPIILGILGEPDWGVIIGGYIGTLLLAAAFLAVGLWISSVTENQIVAFIISLTVIFLLLLIGVSDFLFFIPESLHFVRPFLKNLSLLPHFNSISRGVIDTRDLIYYLTLIGFFLYLNVKNVELRNWK
jgi:ABC-2 type transport system permease protein